MPGKPVEQGTWTPPLDDGFARTPEYRIIETDDPAILEQKVEEKLAEGFKLVGGPFVAPVSSGYGYAYYVDTANRSTFISARFCQAVCR